MYRHLLVPIDDSMLSVEGLFGRAVEFARVLGARITFFHAKADYAGSSVGALERVMSPGTFNEQVAGEARALLAKAEVVAGGRPAVRLALHHQRPAVRLDSPGGRGAWLRPHLHGLPRAARHQEPDPGLADATGAPAHDHSRAGVGRRGQRRRAGIPRARDDHPRGAPVARGGDLRARVPDPGNPRARCPPQFPLLRAMLHYIKAFPETLHHPKEDAYLFAQASCARVDSTRRSTSSSASTWLAARSSPSSKGRWPGTSRTPPGLRPLSQRRWDAIARSGRPHGARSPKVIIPPALQYLTAGDWSEIGRAFAANGDPRFSVDTDEEYRQLFTRILNLAPESVVGGVERRPG